MYLNDKISKSDRGSQMNAKDTYLKIANQSLNERQFKRLERLMSAESDWDGEGAEAMKEKALKNYLTYLHFSNRSQEKTSLFLGHNGEVVISEMLDNGSTLDIVFGDVLIELATDDVEMSYTSSEEDLSNLADSVKEMLNYGK